MLEVSNIGTLQAFSHPLYVLTYKISYYTTQLFIK